MERGRGGGSLFFSSHAIERAILARKEDRVAAILRPQLVVDLAQMPFDGIGRHEQLLGDCEVRVTLRETLQNLRLSRR